MASKVNGVHVAVKDTGRNLCEVQATLPSGVKVTLLLNQHGFIRLDHERANGIADKRTILDGVLTEKKRTFSVYSTSGYANHYKGKPVDPTSAPAVTATSTPESPAGTGSKATSAAPASPSSAAAGSTGTAAAASGPLPVITPTVAVGTQVVRSDGDTGKVTGTGKDAVGAYVEVEWNDHGYESMYEAELKAHEVRPTAASAAGASTSPDTTGKPDASTSGSAPATSTSTRKARKKTTAKKTTATKKTTAKGKAVKKASHVHDALAELVESVVR